MTEIDITNIRAGDTVTVAFRHQAGDFRVMGPVHVENVGNDTEALWVGGRPFANVHISGQVSPRPDVIAIEKHEPVEPPVGSVVRDADGDFWEHTEKGWLLYSCGAGAGEGNTSWASVLSNGVAQILQGVSR